MSLSSALFMDAGNSALKLARQSNPDNVSVYMHGHYQIAELLGKHHDIAPFNEILLASVNGDGFNQSVMDWCNNQQIALTKIQTGSKFDQLKNGYADIQQMGVDRWLGMVSVWQQRKTRFLLASLGSALTCDVVGQDGQHLGGVIVPGTRMMQDCLLQNTAAVRFSPSAAMPASILQNSTQDCAISGTFYTMIAMIEKIQREYGLSDNEVVLTGGLSEVVRPFLHEAVSVQHNLVIKGIASWCRQR